MSKERIFELVRNEELLLFIGAGMSRYAGYPSGAELAEILHENLPSDLREHIDLTLDLSEIADNIYQVKAKNRNYLLDTIKKQFDKIPNNLDTHILLAKIPHFKTIITTNYDDLIERTNKNIDIVRKNSDYSYTTSKKQVLFKIHGDFTDKDSIILTKTDYTKYFSQDKDQTVFWNAIKDRLASNHVLFVGYSLEDSNILTIIDKILNELGEHRKEMYFVAPNIKYVKFQNLRNKGIDFIESTGEDLINEIYEDLRLNYFPKLKKSKSTADTAINFAKENDLNVSFKHTGENVDLDISNVIDNNFEAKFNVEMPNETARLFNDFINNKNFDSFILTEENVKDYSLFLNKIRVKNEKTVNYLEMRKVPSFSEIVDIIFDDGFELESFPVEMYVVSPDKNIVNIKLVLDCFEMIFISQLPLQNNKIDFKIKINSIKPLKNIGEGLKFYDALLRFTSNIGFKVFKNSELIYSNKLSMSNNELGLDYELEYLRSLKLIERHFNVRFVNIELNEYDDKALESILSFIEKKEIKRKFNGAYVNVKSENEINHTLKMECCALIISTRETQIVNLHGIDFNIGYIHQVVYDSYVINKEELLAQKTQKLHFKSKTDSIYIHYSDKREFATTDKISNEI